MKPLTRRSWIMKAGVLVPYAASTISAPGQLLLHRRKAFRVSAGGGSPTPDLVWWKLNEGSGTAMGDSSSGGGGAGTTDAGWTTGLAAGGCLSFGGAASGVTDSSLAIGTDVVTLTLWVNFDNLSGTQVLVEHTANSSGATGAFFLFVASGVLNFSVRASGGVLTKTYAISASTTYHVGALFDNSTSAGNLRGFIDGSEVSLTANTATKASSANFSTDKMYLGARNSSGLYISGDVDDVRLYSGDETDNVSAIYSDPQ